VRLELALEQFSVFLADVVLEHERLELGRLELAPVLLGALDQSLHMLRLEQFDELVLRQIRVSVLSSLFRASDKLTESMASSVLFPALSVGTVCHKLVNVRALVLYSASDAEAVHGANARSPSAHSYLRRSPPQAS